MQRHFDRDIDELKQLLLRMGAVVEDAIGLSIRALLERDTDVAESVIGADRMIDQMELDIDEHTI
ncbi:MAG: PhoU domain-containing protein, partial [Thermoanaerobaculia bacterium]